MSDKDAACELYFRLPLEIKRGLLHLGVVKFSDLHDLLRLLVEIAVMTLWEI